MPKLARIHQLMTEGFVLTEIDSDHGWIEARFQRGILRVTVRLSRAEAERVLHEPSPRQLVHGVRP